MTVRDGGNATGAVGTALDHLAQEFRELSKAGCGVAYGLETAFLGGLTPAREIRDLCASKKVKMRIDGPWCGDIATAANLHLAVGAPPELLVASCD